MTLRTKLLSVAGAIALVSLVMMEWRLYRDAGALVASCAELSSHQRLHLPIENFCDQQAAAFRNSALIRWAAIGLAIILCARVAAMWLRRRFRLSLAALLRQVQTVGIRRWEKDGAIETPTTTSDVETDEVVHALVALDKRVEAALQRIETDSQRASYALISSHSARDLQFVSESIRCAREVLEAARRHQKLPPRQTIENLLFVEREVLALKRSLEAENLCLGSGNPVNAPDSEGPDGPDRNSAPPFDRNLRPVTNQGL